MAESRAWAPRAGRATSIGVTVCVLAAIGLVVAIGVICLTVVRGRITPGLAWLLIPALPVLVGGQLWLLAILSARRREEGWRRWPRSPRDSREFMFAGLPTRWVYAVFTVGLVTWVSGLTSFYWLAAGGPASPTRGCPYRLESHGSYSCVSRSRWLLTGAAEQRLAASVLAFFFVVHLGVAAAHVGRKRQAAAA